MAKITLLFALLFCVTLVSCRRAFKARDYSAYPRSISEEKKVDEKHEEKKEEAKKGDEGYEYDEEKDDKGLGKPFPGKPVGEKPEYKPEHKPGHGLKEQGFIGDKPGIDGGYKPGKFPQFETGNKPEAGGYKPEFEKKPDFGIGKPGYKPDIVEEKPDIKPELNLGKPGHQKPDYGFEKPGYKPIVETGKPEFGKPEYKPEIGKGGYKPEIGKPSVDIVPNVFPPKKPYVPKQPPRPILPPPKKPNFGCGFPSFRPFPKQPGFHRRPIPGFAYRFFGFKQNKKPVIPQKPFIEPLKPGFDKPKPIFEQKPGFGYDQPKPVFGQKPLIEQKPGYEQPKPIFEQKQFIEQKIDYNKPGIIPKEEIKTPDILGKPEVYGKPDVYGKPGSAYPKEINPLIKEEAKFPPLPSQKGRTFGY